MIKLIGEYDATREIGVPVTLVDAVEEFADGSVSFPKLEMLLATVVVARVLVPVPLTGTELRFLRRTLGLTGAEFADAIDLSEKSVISRWENDRVRPGGLTEKVIRQFVLNELGIKVPRNAIPAMKIAPRPITEPPCRSPSGWTARQAPGTNAHSITPLPPECTARVGYPEPLNRLERHLSPANQHDRLIHTNWSKSLAWVIDGSGPATSFAILDDIGNVLHPI